MKNAAGEDDLDRVIDRSNVFSGTSKKSIKVSALDDSEMLRLDPNNKTNDMMLPKAKSEEDMNSIMGTYCAAYFNLGVSFEHLKQFKLSL